MPVAANSLPPPQDAANTLQSVQAMATPAAEAAEPLFSQAAEGEARELIASERPCCNASRSLPDVGCGSGGLGRRRYDGESGVSGGRMVAGSLWVMGACSTAARAVYGVARRGLRGRVLLGRLCAWQGEVEISS